MRLSLQAFKHFCNFIPSHFMDRFAFLMDYTSYMPNCPVVLKLCVKHIFNRVNMESLIKVVIVHFTHLSFKCRKLLGTQMVRPLPNSGLHCIRKLYYSKCSPILDGVSCVSVCVHTGQGQNLGNLPPCLLSLFDRHITRCWYKIR